MQRIGSDWPIMQHISMQTPVPRLILFAQTTVLLGMPLPGTQTASPICKECGGSSGRATTPKKSHA